MDGVILSELKYGKEYVHLWDFMLIEKHDVRLYYKPNEGDKMGFTFYATDFVGCMVNETTDKNRWDKDNCYVNGIYFGVAQWDGIRHLYMGMNDSGELGYCYYPNFDAHIQVLKLLQNLEKKYCKDIDTPL